MVCPFRNKVTFEYANIPGTTKYLASSQTEEWPECYGQECPYYNPTGLCNKTMEEETYG